MSRSKRGSDTKGSVLTVKVIPRSSANRIVGLEGDFLKVKVTSAPIGGHANEELLRVLSRSLRVGKDCIEIVSGHKSRLKTLRIKGISKDELFSLVKSPQRSSNPGSRGEN
jgi:uncharacterized protein (TIGR00251 family)